VGTRDEFRDLLPASYMMFQSVVFRRELCDRFGGFDEHPDRLVGNDWDLLLRYCYHTKTAFIAEPLVAVRVHQQSFTESVARKDGKFAPGRIAIWRKWLVEHDNPPVLDDALWRRMADAFLPDLIYEFGQDRAKIDYYLQQLEQLKRDSMRKIAQVAEQTVCRNADIRKLSVFPGPANVADFSNCRECLNIAGARGFNFLSVFNWELRSGWDLLVNAFVAEFDRTEDVALILQTRPGSGSTVDSDEVGDQLVSFVRNSLGRDPEDIPDIILETADLPDHLLPALYRAADCFVLAPRGEELGHRFVEAMASGLPVIGTNWGDSNELMTAENSFLVDSTPGPVAAAVVQEMPHLAGQPWVEPNIDHLRRQMRRVFESRELAAQTGLLGQREILQRFDPTPTANRSITQSELSARPICEAA
jgi:glycosyltransferase involved in cell wall biosynthesis